MEPVFSLLDHHMLPSPAVLNNLSSIDLLFVVDIPTVVSHDRM